MIPWNVLQSQMLQVLLHSSLVSALSSLSAPYCWASLSSAQFLDLDLSPIMYFFLHFCACVLLLDPFLLVCHNCS